MKKSERLLKGLIWFYLSLGVLLFLVIGFVCFLLPLLSPEQAASSETLDLLEKVLLCWGLILLPFLKIAQVYVKRRQRDSSAVL